MSRLFKLSAFIARGLSSASVAVRPTKAAATRARRIPEGPGLAYFVNSYSPGDGDQPTTTSTAQGKTIAFACLPLNSQPGYQTDRNAAAEKLGAGLFLGQSALHANQRQQTICRLLGTLLKNLENMTDRMHREGS